ncbi:hypothetical protein FF125_01925 [Aureibaculum algae]|uniref:Uncharacterized protein n=1 Tax=Aureibaculum algae TaxID=2584122 RepID=A0A5B7TM08_9FLAO|nr:hypothetical protein [Aureibaculum algae]QCX37258.1 hypothetical protein FF125_01925 [Aureibaculum algae]
MAKIQSVELLSIPEVINAGDDISDLTVILDIEFHDLDVKLQMEYCLHIFIYDIHGKVDSPLVIPNWDESTVISISSDRKDDFLGSASKVIVAENKNETMEIPLTLKLGRFEQRNTYNSRKLEVFATIAPAIGRASKWSAPFESRIVF